MRTIAIHGFGRIGRSTLKAALTEKEFVPAAISDIKDPESLAALFQVDSNYGRWPQPVTSSQESIVVGAEAIRYCDASDTIPDWAAFGVDVVVDCTAKATTRAGAQQHLDRGARDVLVSAPSKTSSDCDAVLLPGINAEQFDPSRHHIVSMASCTTNALAPVIKVLMEHVGIRYGCFSTINSYTNSQSLIDQPMNNRRDCWAAAENIIPSSSSASRALLAMWPELKVMGKAYRVPSKIGSIAELNVIVGQPVTVEDLRNMFRQATASPPLKGIMAVLEEEWASSRVIMESHSSLVDLPLLQVINDTMVSVVAWYDNEYGYSVRLAEMAAMIAATG
jgi:glyceraldehyde 3-phosphate dehydrogenase